MEKERFFSPTNCIGTAGFHSKKKKKSTLTLDPHSITYSKTNSKCTIDINAKPKTTKLLEENIGEKSF